MTARILNIARNDRIWGHASIGFMRLHSCLESVRSLLGKASPNGEWHSCQDWVCDVMPLQTSTVIMHMQAPTDVVTGLVAAWQRSDTARQEASWNERLSMAAMASAQVRCMLVPQFSKAAHVRCGVASYMGIMNHSVSLLWCRDHAQSHPSMQRRSRLRSLP